MLWGSALCPGTKVAGGDPESPNKKYSHHSLQGAAVPGEFIGIHQLPGKDLVAIFEAAEVGHITAT